MEQHAHAADEAAIRAAIRNIESAWNSGDGAAFAAPFAEDADYIVVNGICLKGRMALAEGHQAIFDTIYRASHNTGTIRGVRWLRDDVAVAHVEWYLRFWHDGNPRESHAINTMFFTKEDGVWLIAAFQNTPAVAANVPVRERIPA